MKIGIMTFWWSNDNYGQLLQCYALQKYLREKGHDVFIIRYKPTWKIRTKDKILYVLRHPVKTFCKITRKLTKKDISPETKFAIKKRNFDEFRTEYIKFSDRIYTSYKELIEYPPHADMYIAGSDQIWNYKTTYNKSDIDAYFLNFAEKGTLKYSFAASFGRNTLSDEVKKTMLPLLKGFDYVTVRENSGISICKEMGIDANIVCDPTLLLEKNQYLQLCNKVKTLEKKYVFLYMLSNTCIFSVHKLKEWCTENNLELVYVTGNTGWKKSNFDDEGIVKSYLSIPEWITYLSNAEYVITNSFHCSVFSLIFERRIAFVSLSGELKSTNDRISSLFENLKIEKNEIISNDFEKLKSLKVQKINSELIEESKRILDSFGENK